MRRFGGEQRSEIVEHPAGDRGDAEIGRGTPPAFGDFLQTVRLRDQKLQLGGEVGGGIGAAVIELQAGDAVFNIIGEAVQPGNDRRAAGRHGFERRQPKRLAGLGEARVNEHGRAPIFGSQGMLVEDRGDELACYRVRGGQRPQARQIRLAVAALLAPMRTDNAQAPAGQQIGGQALAQTPARVSRVIASWRCGTQDNRSGWVRIGT